MATLDQLLAADTAPEEDEDSFSTIDVSDFALTPITSFDAKFLSFETALTKFDASLDQIEFKVNFTPFLIGSGSSFGDEWTYRSPPSPWITFHTATA